MWTGVEPQKWPKLCSQCKLEYPSNGYYDETRLCPECRSKNRRRPVLAQIARRSAERAEARANRVCAHCGAPLDAARSTKRFCSTKHRMAAHRARIDAAPVAP